MRKSRHLRNVIALSALAATTFAVTDGLAQAESKTVEQEANVIEETVLENDVEFALEGIDVELGHEVDEGEGTDIILESDQEEQLVLDEEAEVDEPVVAEEESDTEESAEEEPDVEEEQPFEDVPTVEEDQQPVEEAPVVDDEVEAGTPIDQDQSKPKPPFDGEWEYVEVEYGFWIPTGPVPTEFTEADAEKWIAYLDSLTEEEIWMWLDHISDEWFIYIIDLIWWYLDDEWWIEIPEEECNEGGAVTPTKPSAPVEKPPVKEVTQVKHVEKEAGPVLKKSSDTSKASTTGEKLPDTSTDMYNVGFAGLLALLAGVAMRFRRKSTPES
ncbi:LPXTG cell wall anchor domain-containing protein [Geomicrobium sp. JCM 19038]|uniref:LPXTG cell wall anchor domain-containing protein n=1 Tax=Geomicrobium sp. JCM 19038 TaxID=1460635 RepID=UPI0005A9C83B|nr:LPXTG cell wall anchor domain-containing protein [Geomicrobium sp. JCM 19038]